MANWVLQGLRTGIKTTRYPQRAEAAAGVSPGRPIGAVAHSEEDAEFSRRDLSDWGSFSPQGLGRD